MDYGLLAKCGAGGMCACFAHMNSVYLYMFFGRFNDSTHAYIMETRFLRSSSNNLMSSHPSSFGKNTFSLFHLGNLKVCASLSLKFWLLENSQKTEPAVLVSDLVRLCFCLFRKRQREKKKYRISTPWRPFLTLPSMINHPWLSYFSRCCQLLSEESGS